MRFGFTPREIDIAPMLANGSPRKEIAAHLEISIFTVDAHLKNIRRKLEVFTIREAGIVLARFK